MKSSRRSRRVKVSADGAGLASRAGVALLRVLTVDTGLAAGWTDALLDTYKAFPAAHLPGRVLADLAVCTLPNPDRHGVVDALVGAALSNELATRVAQQNPHPHTPGRAGAANLTPGPERDAGNGLASLGGGSVTSWLRRYGIEPMAMVTDDLDVGSVAAAVITRWLWRYRSELVLDAAQLEVLRRYGSEHDVAVGDVLLADGDVSYDLIVVLTGEVPDHRAARPAGRDGYRHVWPVAVPWRDRLAHRPAPVFLSAVASTGRAGAARSRRSRYGC